jgi:hypothetical protein
MNSFSIVSLHLKIYNFWELLPELNDLLPLNIEVQSDTKYLK